MRLIGGTKLLPRTRCGGGGEGFFKMNKSPRRTKSVRRPSLQRGLLRLRRITFEPNSYE